MKLNDLFEQINIDNRKGWGAVPFNADIDYFGLKVQMKPSVFLELALPLDEDQRTSVSDIVQHLNNGGSIGAPFLDVMIPEEWFDGDFSNPAKITSHEGRNRMHAIVKIQGDEFTEVHLIPRGGLRARDLTEEIIEHLNKGMIPERGQTVKKGPLFKN